MKKFIFGFHCVFFGFLVGVILGLGIKTSPKFRAFVIPQGIRGEEAIFELRINSKKNKFDLIPVSSETGNEEKDVKISKK